MPTFARLSSGQAGIDNLVDSIRMGDNVVWQLDSIDQYQTFVDPLATQAIRDGRRLNYVRFATHQPLLTPRPGLRIFEFDPESGFETFTLRIHELIAAGGRDAFYIFDSLSELQTAWASDLMMGCFFQITCPYLFEMNTVAFFAILRNRHSFDAVARVRDTTQLLLDVYGDGAERYVQPLKVWNRYHPAMFTPHRLVDGGGRAIPLADAVEAARFHAILNEHNLAPLDGQLDHWDRTFLRARQACESGSPDDGTAARLAGMLMGRDPRIVELARRHFTTADLIRVKERMIGSGSIGGKAAGMLLARKIVENRLYEVRLRIEPHDSFYIGSDVFYAFLVENGWWRLRLRQRTPAGFFSAADELGELMPAGHFPAATREQFRRMLDYFGQSPIIVRSSSLLEDGFGNAFAGKYESVFLGNSGDPEERLTALEGAIRRVYASAMNPSALAYRRQRGLADRDEQMAILVQRVSGSDRDGLFMPCAAGVGHSHNAYVWDPCIDAEAGMIRLVAGLGTRAVDRVESDYPRIVALNEPTLMPVADAEERARYSQRFVDVIDPAANRLTTVALDETVRRWPDWLRELLCERDRAAEAALAERGIDRRIWYCNCQNMLAGGKVVADMRAILSCLRDAYEYPVDIEFTVNFSESGAHVISILQCRPLQMRGKSSAVAVPDLADRDVLFDLRRSAMGAADMAIDYVLMVDADAYLHQDMSGKYETARIVGRVVRVLAKNDERIMLIGPGRWGTRSPDLGVPVSFAEICGVAALCETATASWHVNPELSFGSHFFQDLVEEDIFYAAIVPGRDGCRYNPELLKSAPLSETIPDVGAAVRVFDVGRLGLRLLSDLRSGRTVCGVISSNIAE